METIKLNFLKNHFSNYEIKFSVDGEFAEMVNPVGSDNIKVQYIPDDEFTPYIVAFAFQHCHMSDEEAVLEYINRIIEGNVFSIEFFNDGNCCFGGDISLQQLEGLSYEKLEKYTGYYGGTKLKELADMVKVRGWHSENNFDAIFVVDEHGRMTIKILE